MQERAAEGGSAGAAAARRLLRRLLRNGSYPSSAAAGAAAAPLLTDAQASAAIEVAGDDSRLACVRSRLLAGRPITIAALGGSISSGSTFRVKRGELGAFLYHAKLARALDLD